MSSRKHSTTLSHGKVWYWTYNDQAEETIVMVHGFRGDHHGLEFIAEHMPKKYKIIIPDLPGYGESLPLNRTHDKDGYVRFLKEFIDALQLDAPPIVLGHSFGSIITSHFAAEYPRRLKKLVLVNPIASPALGGTRAFFSRLTVFYYWVGGKLPERAGRKLLGSKAIVLGTSILLAKTKDKALRRQIHRAHLTHFSSFSSIHALIESFGASVGHTAKDKADKITAPTLLIAGEIDDIAPLKSQRELQSTLANSAQLVIVPAVGHLVHYEAPGEAAEAIDIFCQT